jgi:LCP family protein required for cell wall assembly
MRYVDLGNSQSFSLDKKRKKRRKIILFSIGLTLATIIGVVGYAFYWPLSALIGEILKNPGAVLSFFKNPDAQLKSTDGKTNILLLGIDKRSNVPYTFVGPSGKQERNGFLSDTIIVASFDHNTKKISLVSIPRDTWMSIPGWNNFPETQGKINSAYSIGDVFGYEGGGLQLAKNVVREHLGIPVHYGGRIDFEGFEKIVNTLGGIDVVVDKTFDDYKYPVSGRESMRCSGSGNYCRYEHIHFDKGPTHMNGSTALKYVRSRSGTNGEGSDFARARRQQKVIRAVLMKTLSLENLLNPLKLNNLFQEFGETVETDFNLAAIPQAVKLAKELNIEKIETFVLDPSSGLMIHPSPNLYGGAYVIVPKDNSWSAVKLKIREFLNKPQAKEK